MNDLHYLIIHADSLDDIVRVQLLKEGAYDFHSSVQFDADHSQALLPAIIDMLADAQVPVHSISGIVIIHGPTRFTVSRLASIVANGFGWTNLVPVITLKTLPSIEGLIDLFSVEKYQLSNAMYAKNPTMHYSCHQKKNKK